MKRTLLALAAAATIAVTSMSAGVSEAGHPGFHGHRHAHRHVHGHIHPRHAHGVYRPPVVYRPYVAPPIIYQPPVYCPPQNSFFYQSRNFGLSFGW